MSIANLPNHSIRAAAVEDVDAIFRVRTSVVQNRLTLQQLADLGVTPEVFGFAMVERDAECLFALLVLPQHEWRGVERDLLAVGEAALFRAHALAWLETHGLSRAAGFYRRH